MKAGWKVRPLGELCRIELGKTPPRKSVSMWDKEKSTDNVWLSIADLPTSLHPSVSESKEHISDEALSIMKIVPKGTLMVSFKLTLGRLAFAGKDLYTNEAIAALHDIDEKFLSKEYLYWTLIAFDWHEAAKGDEKVKGKTLNKAKLKLIPIPLPPLEEQRRIVALLDQAFEGLDRVRANTEANLESAKELFESALKNTFEATPENWNKLRLVDICSKIGSGATPRGGKKSYKSQGVSLIRSMNVYDRWFKYKNLAFINDGQAEKLNNVAVEKGDVLFNITGASIARCCVTPTEVLPARVNQHVSILRPDAGILSPEFLCYLMTSEGVKKSLLEIGEEGGSTRQAITKKQLESFVANFPEKQAEQSVIVERLKNLEALSIKTAEIALQKIGEIVDLRQSLLAKAFAGELT